MIWLAHLFRRNHDARRARWFVAGACTASIVIGAAYEASTPACAADPEQCHAIALQLGKIVGDATGDIDLRQAIEMSAEAHCILLDEPPVTIKIEQKIDPERLPDAAPQMNDEKVTWCRAHYGSFRPADGTVLRGRGRKRVPCPWPG